jgi:Na+/proline symporter
VLVAIVGVGLWAYYQEHAMSEVASGLYAQKADRLFPIFVVEAIPTGLKGLVVAGALAAAISSLDSIVAALSQTSLSVLRRGVESPNDLSDSRKLVVFWSLVLGFAAVGIDVLAESYASILDLALAMASYTGGALLAGFLLSFLPLKTDARGYAVSSALSVLAVFAVTSHQDWGGRLGVSPVLIVQCAGAALVLYWWKTTSERSLMRALALVFGVCGAWHLAAHGVLSPLEESGAVRVLAWPWYVPLGSTVAFVWTLLLSGSTTKLSDTPLKA